MTAEALQEPGVLWEGGGGGCLGASLLLWLGWVWKPWVLSLVAYLVTRLQLVIHLPSLILRSISLGPQQTESLRTVKAQRHVQVCVPRRRALEALDPPAWEM